MCLHNLLHIHYMQALWTRTFVLLSMEYFRPVSSRKTFLLYRNNHSSTPSWNKLLTFLHISPAGWVCCRSPSSLLPALCWELSPSPLCRSENQGTLPFSICSQCGQWIQSIQGSSFRTSSWIRSGGMIIFTCGAVDRGRKTRSSLGAIVSPVGTVQM